MNESNLDAGLRTAFQVPESGPAVDRKIDAALARFGRGRRIRRRLMLSFGATAAAALAVWAIPVVQAQAAISRIAGALDDVNTVVITKFAVDEEGRRSPAGIVAYNRGHWRMNDGSGSHAAFYSNGKNYSFDETLGAYVMSDRPAGPFARNGSSLRVSNLLAEAEGDTWSRRASTDKTTLNGRDVLRVSIENGRLPEKYVIYADPQSELPIEVDCQANELGQWRTREVMSFDYGAAVDERTFEPDLARYPAISAAEADRRFASAITSRSLASAPLKKGRLVVRSFDVADDGTVFVVYQSGDMHRNSSGGSALELTADDGSVYLRADSNAYQAPDSRLPAEGKLEVETFVPLEPQQPWHPRTLTLDTNRFGDGALARRMRCEIEYPNGTRETKWQFNRMTPEEVDAQPVALLKRAVDKPDCAKRPAFLARIDDMSFGNDIRADMTKAVTRARYYAGAERWSDALRWYNEDLRLKRLHERLGYGPWGGRRSPRDRTSGAGVGSP